MSAWTPEAQAMFERITSHYKPYGIEPTLKERTLLVSRLTIVATERLDLGALLESFWGLSWVQPHSWLWAPWKGMQSAMLDITCDRQNLKRLADRLKTIPEVKRFDFMPRPYVEKSAHVMWKKYFQKKP